MTRVAGWRRKRNCWAAASSLKWLLSFARGTAGLALSLIA
jgi:hypothetical protein